MSFFTMPLCEVIEMEGEDNIGLSDYPIFDEQHREVLNKKIIDQFWNQEIGQETISMFRLAMKRKMNNIMPMYNEHYRLSAIPYEVLSTFNIESSSTVDAISETSTAGETTSKNGAKSRAVASSFPQQSLQADSDYATSAQDNTSETDVAGESTETQNANQQSNNSSRSSGYQGHAPELIFAARQTIVNIDIEILTELETLFMGVWGTGNEYARTNNNYGF